MARYVLGEKSARKFKELINGTSGTGNRKTVSPGPGIQNLYPDPWTVRWAQSANAGAGAYIIWLPPEILYVDKQERYPAATLEPASDENDDFIYPAGWYKLDMMLSEEDSPYSSWAETDDNFEVYLDYSAINPSFHFQGDGSTEFSGRTLIAQVIDKNVKQSVDSALIIDSRPKPFDLVLNASLSAGADSPDVIWHILRPWFKYGGQYIELQEQDIGPFDPTEGNHVVRLCYDAPGDGSLASPDDFTIDWTAASSLTSNADTGYTEVWPLYMFSPDGSKLMVDYRDAFYIIDEGKTDDQSITMFGDDWKKTLSTGQEVDVYHLWHFHDDRRDYELSTIIEGDGGWNFDVVRNLDFVVRERSQLSNELAYVDMESIFKNLYGGKGAAGGWAPKKEDILSALTFDEKSVSKGGDGWTGISGDAVHMWHFHDNGANTNTAAHSDFILRTPDGGSDAAHLEYISWNDLTTILSTALGGGGGGGDWSGQISADQLSAIPSPGMFAWTESTRNMGVGGCMVGRKWFSCTNGIGSGKADGLYQLRVTISGSGDASLAVVSGASLGQAPTTTQCWIPIYQITDGKIAADYRGAFVVPAFD